MIDRIFGSEFAVYYLSVFIMATILIIPVFCMLFSGIRNKRRYEIYANGELSSACMCVFGFIMSSFFAIFAIVTFRENDKLCLALSIIGTVIFVIGFLTYCFIVGQRRRVYGENVDDSGYTKADVVCGIVEILCDIFDIFISK